ncbi:hypothetical protein TRFO_28324 [Tritrichomonas foetus]|uniref:C2H2-type domain-containing protein n=1 Tax=Tritrichomonas foetus TaxID=1144522 RepID=A0A1J4K394_9EUKA|nr:hypothetical protein TRFO_28324 [Tritrichomonas foetus]|eukprot:OHT04220.1 hypothetical protein TRFO_28324 [Tritrichomonas foetus]
MIPPHFNVFRAHNPDESPIIPVVPSSAVDWDLISSIDPSIISCEDKKFLKFLDAFPTYKLSSIDSNILFHPLSIRFFLIMQYAIAAVTQKIKYYVKLSMRKQRDIDLLEQKVNDLKDSQPVFHKEKCYACGKRFTSINGLNQHIKNEHSYLKKPWRKIRKNTKEDIEETMINDLTIKVNQLRQYIFDQDERYNKIIEQLQRKLSHHTTKVKPDPHNVKVSYMAVQPQHAPTIYNTIRNIYKPDIGMINDDYNRLDEELRIAGETFQDTLQNQAAIVLNKRKKNFNKIREHLRIHLEKNIPMPVPIDSNYGKQEPDSQHTSESSNSHNSHSSHKSHQSHSSPQSHSSKTKPKEKKEDNPENEYTYSYYSTDTEAEVKITTSTTKPSTSTNTSKPPIDESSSTNNKFGNPKNNNVFYITDTEVSSRTNQSTRSRFSPDKSSSKRRNNKGGGNELVTDDEEYSYF